MSKLVPSAYALNEPDNDRHPGEEVAERVWAQSVEPLRCLALVAASHLDHSPRSGIRAIGSYPGVRCGIDYWTLPTFDRSRPLCIVMPRACDVADERASRP